MTTLNLSIDFTETQLTGIAQARTAYNATLPELSTPLTDIEYLQYVLSNAATSYALQYSGAEPVALSPIAPVARSIDARRLRLALSQLNLLEAIENAILGLDKAAQIDWQFATTVKADNPLVVSLASALNLNIDSVIDLAETFT